MPDRDPPDTVYSNGVLVSVSPAEFMLDFRLMSPDHPELEQAPRQVRVVMHPHHAARLAIALAQAIEVYQKEHGAIPGVELNVHLEDAPGSTPSGGGSGSGN